VIISILTEEKIMYWKNQVLKFKTKTCLISGFHAVGD